MWYLLLMSLMFYANADDTKNLLEISIEPNQKNPMSSVCYQPSRKLMEGEQAYIDFYVNDTSTLNHIEKCFQIGGNEELNLKFVEKYNRRMRYKIKEVEDWMNKKWSCHLIDGALCRIDIQVRSRNIPQTVMNSKTINMARTDSTTLYDAMGTYYFTENLIIKINCSGDDNATLKIMVEDEADFTDFNKDNPLIMWMKMTKEHDDTYVDCHQKKNGVQSNVRTILKVKPKIADEGSWKLEINGQHVEPTRNDPFIDYYFVEGQNMHVSCQNAIEESGSYSDMVVSSETYSPILTCPEETSNIKDYTNKYAISFLKVDTRGLKGLVADNIRFIYIDNMRRLIIHYDFDEGDVLATNWTLNIEDGGAKNFTIRRQDELIKTQVIEEEYPYQIVIPDINLRHDDHHGKIIFGWKETNKNYTNEIIIMKFRLKKVNEYTKGTLSELVFGVSVGGGCVVFVIIVVITIWLIIRRKRARKSESPDSYGNLLSDDSSIPPYPPRWDSCNTSDMEPRYTEVPDCYRTPKNIKGTSNSKKDEFYGAVEVCENSLYDKQPEHIYSYAETTRGKEENLYCEIES